jgi:hypothetical protein
MPLDALQEQQLTGGGDTLLHYHLADRVTNARLQADARQVTVTEATYIVADNDEILLVDTSAASATLTLPPSRGGKEYEVVKIAAANSITVDADGSDTICGAASMLLTLQWSAARLKAVSGGWILI